MSGADPRGLAPLGTDFRWRERYDRVVLTFPGVCGWIALGVGLVVLVGWLFDVEDLKSIDPWQPAIKANTAVAVALVGLALLCLRADQPARVRRAGALLGGAGGLLGLLFVLEYVLGPIGIDEILFDDSGSLPGRPGLHTAIALLLLGFAAFVVDRSFRDHWVYRALVWAAGIAAIAACVAVVYDVSFGPDVEEGASMTLRTALLMSVLAVGFIFLRPDRGLAAYLRSPGPGPALARYLLPAAVLVPIGVDLLALVARDLGMDADVSLSLATLLIICLFISLLGFTSRRLSAVEKRRLEAEGKVAERAEILRHMAEGVSMARVDTGAIVFANPRFEEMHGYGPGELNGRPVSFARPGDLSEEEAEQHRQLAVELAREGTIHYENRSVKKDGADIWCHATASIVEHPEYGEVLIVVKADVTREREASMARQRAEQRFRRVFEEGPLGICLVDPDFSFSVVNAAFCDIVGYSARELAGMTFAEITHPDDLEADATLARQLYRGEIPSFRMEKRYIKKSGETVWVHLTASRIGGSDGEPVQALSMVEDITDRRRFREKLEHQADHDFLTGLFNRRRFEIELIQVVDEVRSRGRTGAAMTIDLDNFKYVNDTYGHSIGDRLIRRVAKALQARLKSADTLARLGGDEFAVLLPDVERERIAVLADDLVREIRANARIEEAEVSVRATASIGWTTIDVDGPEASELMIEADVAMYDAKEAGRDRAVGYDREQEERSRIRNRLDWADRIRGALEEDRFELYVQPIVSLDGDPRPRHELLLRLRGEDGVMAAPGAFLAVAERMDLIQDVDRWVVGRAIDVLAEQQARGHDICLEVNLSGKSIDDPRTVELISERLRRAGADPGGLVFEVTETVAIANLELAKEFADRLSRLGCSFALDDFGAGFASFYYLKHLSCEYLKIDGEFVRGIARNVTNQLIVQSLVSISEGLGKKTIAEFVEDEETLETLRAYGVDYAQGYHVGKPAPLERADLNRRLDVTGSSGG